MTEAWLGPVYEHEIDRVLRLNAPGHQLVRAELMAEESRRLGRECFMLVTAPTAEPSPSSVAADRRAPDEPARPPRGPRRPDDGPAPPSASSWEAEAGSWELGEANE